MVGISSLVRTLQPARTWTGTGGASAVFILGNRRLDWGSARSVTTGQQWLAQHAPYMCAVDHMIIRDCFPAACSPVEEVGHALGLERTCDSLTAVGLLVAGVRHQRCDGENNCPARGHDTRDSVRGQGGAREGGSQVLHLCRLELEKCPGGRLCQIQRRSHTRRQGRSQQQSLEATCPPHGGSTGTPAGGRAGSADQLAPRQQTRPSRWKRFCTPRLRPRQLPPRMTSLPSSVNSQCEM